MTKKDENLLEKAEDTAKEVEKTIQKEWKPTFRKYPLTFTLLSIFGFSAVLYGFERFFDTIPFFNKHPIIVLLMGLIVLAGTGTLYKWLQNKEINIQ